MFTFNVILFAAVFQSKIVAQTPDQLMTEANKNYQDQQYERAIEAYQKILSQGFESSSLYYNLGNAYFRSGKIGFAILNYERGLKLSPSDDDLSFNLKIANSRTYDKISELPKLFIVKWWELLITSFSLTGWSVILIVVYFVFLTGLGLFFLSRRAKLQRLALMISSISLAMLIIAVVILVSRYNYEATTNHGILTAELYSVKASPDSRSSDAFVIHEGIKFVVEDQVNDWFKIRLVDGKIGWIQKNVFGQI
jgi:tetratricopeptide (TPR) repeat protein